MKYSSLNILNSSFNIRHSTFYSILLFFILQSSFVSQQSFSQTISKYGSPFIRNYTPNDYKGSSQNWAIVQDKRGIMYFGNNYGVLEFDGKNWRLIETSNKSVVRSLAIDNNGTIYVGASGEFGFLASDSTGTLKYISLINKLKEEDRNFGDVWRAYTTSHGIYFLTLDKIFLLNNDTINVLQVQLASQFGFLINDTVFIIQKDKGLYILKNNKPCLLPYTKKFATDIGRTIILPYSENEILIVTDNIFYIYNYEILTNQTSISSDYSNKYDSLSIVKEFFTEIDQYIYNNTLYAYTTIGKDYYALATLNGGIIIMGHKGELIRIINKNRGLQSNTVLNLFIDNNRNLWATLSNGISEIEISSPITKFNDLNGLEGTVLSVIKYNKKIYAGTINGVYYLPEYEMNITNDKYNFLHIANTKSTCWDFFPINNTLFASGRFGVACILDTLLKELNKIGKIFCFDYSNKFPNHIFVGLVDGFACVEIKFPDKNNNVSPYQAVKIIDQIKFKNINNTIRKIVCDTNGDIMLTTFYNGLIHLKFINNDLYNPQLTRYDTTHGLPNLKYNIIFKINNDLIVATQRGFYKAIMPTGYNSNDTLVKFFPDTTYSKYFYDNSLAVYQIYVDSTNEIWISADDGIGTMKKNNDGTYKWNKAPFKKISNCSNFYYDEDGIVWFCTNNGLFRYNTNIKKDYNIPFHSLIRKVTLGKDSVIFQGTYYNDSLKINNYFTTASLTQPKKLIPEMDYNNNSMTFEFSSAFYENISANQFQYILEGFDKEWSDWTNETKKEYTNLHEGTYFFKVKAKNIFEYESTEAIYEFTILPPLYRTIFAYIIYILIFILIFYFGIRLNTKRLKALNVRLEKIVKERTFEIHSQKKEIQVQAEQLLEINNELEKLSIVASETDNGVMIMDAEGKIEWVNEGYTKMLGYTLNDLLIEKGNNLLKVSSYKNISGIFQSIHNSKKPIIYESENTTKSGKKKWVQTTITPILDSNNKIRKLISIDSNITKLKNAEEEITDSIIYAKRIQNALFPSKEIIKNIINEYFILDLPQGIISGDFYWFSKIKNKTVIAVADCTGHGVPGAFMSMLGVTMLNKIVNEKGIDKPNEILDRLRNNVIISLHQTGEIGEANDGMDIALITIDKKNNSLEYAGANNSAYLFRNNELTEIFADKMPIGIYSEIETPFSCQKISIQTGDIIYLFTDGYADQFGGSRGRKFLYKNFKKLLKELHHLPMNEQKTRLFKTHRKWKDNNEQVDDILVMGIKI
ncbi:MAG: SpoIIE family protein phosphatase [Bacteroidales bacterium]|nr:SpoIIE family protein phosphatase [Bacteroidales bacterium]